MQSSRSAVSFYNLFYIFLSIIWVPVQRYYLHFDGAGRSILVLSIVAVLLNITSIRDNKRLFLSLPFICWTLLVVYSLINSVIKGSVSELGTFDFFRSSYIIPFIFLLITLIELKDDREGCLRTILFAQLLYLAIGASHISINEFERMGAEELGNALPIMASGCAFIASILFCDHQLRGGWLSYMSILAFVLIIIVIVATRKAFGAVILVVAGMILGRMEKVSYKTVTLLFVFMIVVFLGVNYILDNTYLGSRFASSSEQYNIELSSNQRVNKILAVLLGDRDIQYYLAMELFPQHPVTGIGLGNFREVAGLELRLHSEYMVQLCENGIIGFSLLLLFYFSLVKGLNKRRKEGMNIMMPLFGLLMILFLNITSWTYNLQIAMIVYAVLITEAYSSPDYSDYLLYSPESEEIID